jgi:hypothetical protein
MWSVRYRRQSGLDEIEEADAVLFENQVTRRRRSHSRTTTTVKLDRSCNKSLAGLVSSPKNVPPLEQLISQGQASDGRTRVNEQVIRATVDAPAGTMTTSAPAPTTGSSLARASVNRLARRDRHEAREASGDPSTG